MTVAHNKLTRAVCPVAQMKLANLHSPQRKNAKAHLLVSRLLTGLTVRGGRQEKRLGGRGASAT